jgi:mannose-6-phosphate isomerase-like protein (cupin superfamily)
VTDEAEQARERIVNEQTGEQITFVVDTAELLQMSVVWTRPGHRAVRHAHPGIEERWEILEGQAAIEVDGVLVEAGRGSRVTAPPGRPHLAWNPTEEPVKLRIEMRPALRWADFTRQLFSGEDPVRLLRVFSEEIVLAPLTS